MADEEKKVSFGFSKTIKKSALKITPKQDKKFDYIECLDEKAIRVVGGEERKDEKLVIPMLGSKTWCDRIFNKTDVDIFKTKTKAKENVKFSQIKNSNANINPIELTNGSQIKKEIPDETETASKTLEEQAAHEIIEDFKCKEIKVHNPNLPVNIAEDELRGKQESTLEDYEQIPVDGFGLAVLRGMGWKPGKGIGKNEKLIAATLPELRPRSMGLGADKLTLQKQNNKTKMKKGEQLKVAKGSFVKVITGKHNSHYGQIESFDDGAGRLIVKMALNGETLSLNENVVEPVTKAQFAKNSKVLNVTKFEEYKNKTQRNGNDSANVVSSVSETSKDQEKKNRLAVQSKKSSRRKKLMKQFKYSSDERSDSDHRLRKRRSSSVSDYECRQKKSKKSQRRDNSLEPLNKKGMERENTSERKTGYLQSSNRRLHKRHKGSQSHSPRRR